MAAATAPITPSFEYGGTVGQTQYFVSGRYFGSDIGIENPTPRLIRRSTTTPTRTRASPTSRPSSIPTSRLTLHQRHVVNQHYQISEQSGQTAGASPPSACPISIRRCSTKTRSEFNQFNVLACRNRPQGSTSRSAYFNRYSSCTSLPDTVGDLMFNGVASDVYRRSIVNGIQGDSAYRLGDAHTLRAGFSVSAERTLVNNASQLLPVDAMGASGRCAVPRDRFERQDRLAVRHLSAGRMEDHQPADPERRRCGSTRCGNTSTPTSSARASA